jgi:hypothetical protein
MPWEREPGGVWSGGNEKLRKEAPQDSLASRTHIGTASHHLEDFPYICCTRIQILSSYFLFFFISLLQLHGWHVYILTDLNIQPYF